MTSTSVSTSSRRASYDRDGFVLCPDVGVGAALTQSAAQGLCNVRDGIYDTGREPDPSPWKPGGPADKLVKIENPQLASSALKQIISHEGIGRAALEITGADWVQIWWVQGLIKPSTPAKSAAATNVGWHQDKQYWKEWQNDSELFTGWLALSDVHLATGPMFMVPGSHTWGLLNQGDFFSQDQQELRNQIKIPAGQAWREVPATLPPGGISFHHQLTFHASGPNNSGSPRMSLALHMRTNRSKTILEPDGKEPWVAQWVNDTTICPKWYR